MKTIRTIWLRIRSLWQRREAKREIDEELRFHLEQRTAENLAAGMSPEEAAREARKRFGNVQSIREECRETRGASFGEATLRDIRFGLRRLCKNPGFTATILLTLALCIGANVVIFAVVDAILLRPLPFPKAGRLVIVTKEYPGAGTEHQGCSLRNYYDWREGIAAFASVSAVRSGSVVLGDTSSPQRLLCERVTPEFLSTLGVRPALGRFFTEEETYNSRSAVVVLTDAYWRSCFNADPGILGRAIRVDGQACIIVGILPRDFRYLSSRAQLFFPLASTLEERAPNQRHNLSVQVIARLSPGASLGTAQAQIRALDARQLEDDPYAAELKAAGFHTNLSALHADHVRSVRPTLLLLQAGALFLLLIGGVNLINLLLIRASTRTREFAVRQALGASRRHVAREVVVETVLLGGLGGALGLGLGAFGIRLLSLLGTTELPLGASVSLDGRVAAVVLFGSLLVSVALAVPIIWFNLRNGLALALQTGSRGGGISHAAQRLRHGFIIAQIALAFMLLTGAGLLGVSLQRVLAVAPGFQPEKVLTGRVELPGSRYPEEASRLAFVERLLRDLRTQPGVTFAAVSTVVPFTGQDNNQAMAVEGIVPRPGDSIRVHFKSATSGEFWQALGIPLRQGRLLEDADSHRDERVCVVDEAFAERYWPHGEAIGHRLVRSPKFNEQEAFTIVGIVGRVKQETLVETALGSVYFPYRYDAAGSIYVITRTTLAPAALGSTLERSVHRADAELPVDDIRPMQARVDESLIPRRSPALLACIFAAVALSLTAVGTYGALAYAVTQRRREIGVRMALGAAPQQVLTEFVGLGVKLLLSGIIFGALGAWALGRAMASLLFGVGTVHLGVLGASAGVMMLVVLLACFIPARRAARVNPMEALRCE